MNWVEYETDSWYHETDDPRVLAIITRDPEPEPPNGDAYAPAYWVDNCRGTLYAQKSTYQDSETDRLAMRILEAETHFKYAAGYRRDGLSIHMIIRAEEMMRRWLNIFYPGVWYTRVSSGYRGDSEVMLVWTPSFAKHVGITSYSDEDIKDFMAGDVEVWAAYLDGDVYGVAYLDGEVYGVSYAVNEDRRSPDEEIDMDYFDVGHTCWGFYGKEYAQDAALSGDSPLIEAALPEFLF